MNYINDDFGTVVVGTLCILCMCTSKFNFLIPMNYFI